MSDRIYENVFEYAPAGIVLVSPQGNFMKANHAFCNMLGYTEAELVGKSICEITHPDDAAMHKELAHQLFNKEKKSVHLEKRAFTKTGSVVHAQVSVSLVWEGEKPAFFVSQVADITQKKLLADEAQQLNKELEKANKELQNHIISVNEFNRIIGHNLRGPASSMINAADYLEKTDNEQERNLLLSKMKSTSVLILNTINDLKEFLEIQLNHDAPKTPAVFNDALQKSISILADQVKETGAIIHTRFLSTKVVYPAVYLESLFYNLVSNALKYRNPAVPPAINIAAEPKGDNIVLTVSDNGIGINLERYGNDIFKYRKIFHRGYDSNGVGLFLTKTQLDAHGAAIVVSSTVNEGTTFTIYFKKA